MGCPKIAFIPVHHVCVNLYVLGVRKFIGDIPVPQDNHYINLTTGGKIIKCDIILLQFKIWV